MAHLISLSLSLSLSSSPCTHTENLKSSQIWCQRNTTGSSIELNSRLASPTTFLASPFSVFSWQPSSSKSLPQSPAVAKWADTDASVCLESRCTQFLKPSQSETGQYIRTGTKIIIRWLRCPIIYMYHQCTHDLYHSACMLRWCTSVGVHKQNTVDHWNKDPSLITTLPRPVVTVTQKYVQIYASEIWAHLSSQGTLWCPC